VQTAEHLHHWMTSPEAHKSHAQTKASRQVQFFKEIGTDLQP
jgi:hypothetical protein